MNSPMRDASSMKTVGSFGVVESEQAAGRLDYQLAGLDRVRVGMRSGCGQADRIVAAIRWGCRESRIDKES
jgi:hypothetical protein